MENENTAAGRTIPVLPEDVIGYLTAKEAASLAGVSVAELSALAATHSVPAFWVLVDGADAPEPVFPLWAARRIAENWVKATDVTRPLVVPLYTLLQSYVRECEPVASHNTAVATGHPLVARAGSRYGHRHVHVRPEGVAGFAENQGLDIRLRSISTISEMLPLVHAQKVTGLRDGEGVQTGRIWWRLPLNIVDPGEGDDE